MRGVPIHRWAFQSEAGRNVFVFLLVLGGLGMMVSMGRLVTDNTSIPALSTLALLGLQMVKLLPQFLTVSLFAGLVVTFSRMSQSRELLAWGVAGLRDRHWQASVMMLAAPVAILIWLLALHGAPWSIRFAAAYERDLADRIKLEDTAPGIFGEIPSQGMVYHIQALGPDRGTALGVFIARSSASDIQLALADRAQTEIDDYGLRDLILDAGELHSLSFSERSSSRVRFDSAEFRLGSEDHDSPLRRRAKELSDLGPNAPERVEYLWRHSFLATAVVLALLALHIGRGSPGTGRGYQVALATLSYWLYYSISGYAKDLGEGGTVDPVVAAFGPPALLALPLLALALSSRARAMR